MQLPVAMVDKMERKLRDLIEGERLYLKPDLTKSELVSLLGTNELYLHIVLKQRFGAFNRYVNTLRLEHAMRYEKQHPEAKREKMAMRIKLWQCQDLLSRQETIRKVDTRRVSTVAKP